MKNLFKTLAVVVILVLTTVSFTSCDTEPLPEPESKVTPFIGVYTLSNDYSSSVIYGHEYGQQIKLKYQNAEIVIDDCSVFPFNKTLGHRKITKDSIGYANNQYDINNGNRMLVIDGGKYLIRYKRIEDITVNYY